MARPISLLFGVCALFSLAQGRALRERGVNRDIQQYPLSQRNDGKDDSIPTILLIENKDAIVDALVAVNEEELEKRKGSRSATEFVRGVYRSDGSNGERMVYRGTNRFGDKRADRYMSYYEMMTNFFYGGNYPKSKYNGPNYGDIECKGPHWAAIDLVLPPGQQYKCHRNV